MKRPIAPTAPRYRANGVNDVRGAGRMNGVAKPTTTAMKPNVSRRSASAIHVERMASTKNSRRAAPVEMSPYQTAAAYAVTYQLASAPP